MMVSTTTRVILVAMGISDVNSGSDIRNGLNFHQYVLSIENRKKENIVQITIHLQIYNFKFKTLNFKQNKTL